MVYARLKIQIELVDVPAKRALVESSSGDLDGEVHRVLDVASEYPTLLPLRPAINYIEPSVFIRSANTTPFEISDWESIRDYRIGIVRGVGSSERGTAGMPHVESINTLNQGLKMLAADRLDIMITDRFSGKVALKN